MYKPFTTNVTNSDIRAWYQKRVAEISKLNQEWSRQGNSLEQRARQAWQIRHDARIEARSTTQNVAELEDLRERDLRLYGNSDGPTFEQLVQENIRRRLRSDEFMSEL